MPTAYPRNAREAFDQERTYRPRTWGIGVNARHPRENGVELISRAGVRELVLFHYHTPVGGKVRKWAVDRKPAPDAEQADPFTSNYEWVESKKEVA